MIASLKPYPAMKDSGVKWLGEVPEHWEASKIKHLARSEYKAFVDGDWIESPFITSDGIRLIQTGNSGQGFIAKRGTDTSAKKRSRSLDVPSFNQAMCSSVDSASQSRERA